MTGYYYFKEMHRSGSVSLLVGIFTGIITKLLINSSIYDGIDRRNFASYNHNLVDGANLHRVINFNDEHLHNDDDHVSKEMAEEVRVLCWVMTSQKTLYEKAIHVRDTWAKRCNIMLFMSDVDDLDFPALGLGTGLGRSHLTAKTMRAFEYLFQNHYDDADWFLKADDDTFVVVENLRYMLSAHAPTEPVFFGHHFKTHVSQGYFSGGAGYAISKEALWRYGNRPTGLCANDSGAEDVEIGHCMEKLGVLTGDSRDILNRSRFHCFGPGTHLGGGYPEWYYTYDKYGAQKGLESMSDYPVSYHYVGTELMYALEYMFYHMSAYGITNSLQQLNKPSITDQYATAIPE